MSHSLKQRIRIVTTIGVSAVVALAAGAALATTSIGTDISTGGKLTVAGNTSIDTDTLFVDSTNNRVGIGTVSPSHSLTLRPATNVPQLMLNEDATAGNGWTLWADSSNGKLTFTRLAASANDRVSFTAAGDLVINGTTRISSAGAFTGNGAALTNLDADTLDGIDSAGFLTTALSSGKILVGNSSNLAAEVTMSGDATISNTGAVTVTKPFAMFYGLTSGTGNGTASDYVATVAVGAAVPFPRTGPQSPGITRASPTAFVVNIAGTYEVTFSVHTSEPGQLQLTKDGVAVDECIGTTSSGGQTIVADCVVAIGASSSLQVINATGNAVALTVTPADGQNTHANAQTLVLKKL